MVTRVLDEGARATLATTRFADVRWFGEIDSTNRYLLDEARRGAPEGIVAVADHQTAGRGRLGRTWIAPPAASLLVSILLRPALALEALHLVNVAVALSAADACRVVARVEPVLKWPNDLLVDDRKLAGVLAEADQGAVVVGIGLNVNWPEDLPEELAETAVALNHVTGRPVNRVRLLTALLSALETRCVELGSEAGRRTVAAEYRDRCATVGRQVRVELHGETFTGTAEDISDLGHLVVSTDAGPRTVHVGDVTHLRLA